MGPDLTYQDYIDLTLTKKEKNLYLQLLQTSKNKSNLHYTRRTTPKCATSLGGPSPRLSAWATQLRRNVATVASRWRHCVDLTGPGMEPQTSRTDSERFATELTAGLLQTFY